MTRENLRGEHNVVQYIRPGLILDFPDEGTVDSAAFLWDRRGCGLSVSWLEYSTCPTKDQQLEAIRNLIHRDMSRNGLLAELNVGTVISRVSDKLDDCQFVRTQSPPTERYPWEDPSHCELVGVPPEDAPDALSVSRTIAQCITNTHTARNSPTQ